MLYVNGEDTKSQKKVSGPRAQCGMDGVGSTLRGAGAQHFCPGSRLLGGQRQSFSTLGLTRASLIPQVLRTSIVGAALMIAMVGAVALVASSHKGFGPSELVGGEFTHMPCC